MGLLGAGGMREEGGMNKPNNSKCDTCFVKNNRLRCWCCKYKTEEWRCQNNGPIKIIGDVDLYKPKESEE